MNALKSIASAVSVACLAAAAPALAQDEDERELSGEAVEAIVTYAMPLVFSGASDVCSSELSPDGFLNANRARILAKYEQAAEGSWPAAKDALVEYVGSDEDFAKIMEMEEEAVRPFMDGMIKLKIAEEIDASACRDIEAVLEVLDPLPAQNLAKLVGLIVDLAD